MTDFENSPIEEQPSPDGRRSFAGRVLGRMVGNWQWLLTATGGLLVVDGILHNSHESIGTGALLLGAIATYDTIIEATTPAPQDRGNPPLE